MKKLNLFLLLAFFAGITLNAATKYCDTELTANGHTIHLSTMNMGNNVYRYLVTSNETMTRVYDGAWCSSSNGNVQMMNYYTLSPDGKTITIDIPSTTPPHIYTSLQIIFPTGTDLAQFSVGDEDFSCSAGPVDDEAPTMTSASLVSKTHNSAVIAVAATDNVGVTKYVVYNNATKQGEYAPADGKITVTGLAQQTAYTLTIKAKDAAGNESKNSKEVTFTTDAFVYYKYATGHLGQAEFGDANGRILLTLTKMGANSVNVLVEPNNAGTIVDWAEVSVNGVVGTAGAKSATSTQNIGEIALQNVTLPATGTFPVNITWHTPSLGGDGSWTTNSFQVATSELYIEQGVAVTGVSIPETLNLTEGKSQTLTATITPANASNQNVSWEITEGTDYAEVDATGKVTAKAEGTAEVTVTTEDGGFTATCTVTVTAAPVITNPYCETEVGHQLNPSADPSSFILLSIGSDGEGHTIVNIKQDAAKNTNKFDYLQVSGHASTGADVETGGVTEMAVKFATPTPDVNGDITLEILWSTVGWSGRWMVQNLKVPATATCASAVVPEVPEAEVKTYYGYLKHAEKGVYVGYSITRNKDNTLTFNAQVDSETNIAAAYINVKGTELGLTKNVDTYSAKTSATFIEGASLDNTYFHFILEGTANIADIPVTTYTIGASNEPVTFPTEKVTLDKANLSFAVGDADQALTARVYPNFATNTTVAWTTDAEGVATVSNGSVHPVAAGDATITATCEGKTATCAVNVVAALEDASYYGTGSFKTPVDQSYVAYNYNFTRKANHGVILTVVFERDVTSYIESNNFQFFENNTVHNMTYTAATKTATYSFGNMADGSEIVNFYFRFVLNSGGLGETSPFTYTVGSTNEQPNKLIAINEVLANTLTDGEFVDALLGRTFLADGANYTLCLPFDMTAEQCLDAFGAGYKLYLLGNAYMKSDDMMYLPFSEVTAIEAGKPYLFCPATKVENPTIEGVTINAAAPVAQGNNFATMMGIYSPTVVAASNYVLGDDNWLYQSDGGQMYGLRCYFTFGSGVQQNVRARAVFHNSDVTTDFEPIHRFTDSPIKVIKNGHLYIIRNNARYNGIGQQVK